jgi:hypothetical protein
LFKLNCQLQLWQKKFFDSTHNCPRLWLAEWFMIEALEVMAACLEERRSEVLQYSLRFGKGRRLGQRYGL